MKKVIQKLLGSAVAKNSIWLIGEQVFQMALSFVVSIISARYLGPSNYGTLGYTASFITFCTSLTTLGMDSVVIKRIISRPEKEGEILGGCMVLRLGAAVFSALASIIVVYVLNPGDKLKLVLVSIESLQLLFLALNILDDWFQRHLMSKYVATAKMVSGLAVSAYKLFLLATAKSIEWFAFSNVISIALISIILVISYLRRSKSKLKVDIKSGLDVLSESYHFIISGLMTAIYGTMDKMMLGTMITDAAVGFYNTAAALCSAWIFVPLAIINSFQPKIMELKQSGDETSYLIRLKQVYSLIIWLCLFASAGVCLLGRIVIFYLYGEAYLPAVLPLRILIWSETFSMIGCARGIWVLCEDKSKYVKYYLGIGALANFALNYALIPSLGPSGAALATLFTQIITSIVAPLLFKETKVHTFIVAEALTFKWYFDNKRIKNER